MAARRGLGRERRSETFDQDHIAGRVAHGGVERAHTREGRCGLLQIAIGGRARLEGVDPRRREPVDTLLACLSDIRADVKDNWVRNAPKE